MAEEREVEMVVVDGVRYRPEDVPKEKARTAQNKARTATTKTAEPSRSKEK